MMLSACHAHAQQQRRVRSRVGNSDAYAFFNLLTGLELFDEVESLLPRHRERLFPPTETLSEIGDRPRLMDEKTIIVVCPLFCLMDE